MVSFSIIYASTGGHAKFVAKELMDALVKASGSVPVSIDRRPAELSRDEDLLDADVLVLVSSEVEGKRQLDEQMQTFLFGRATDIDLDGRYVACVSLSGDEETAEMLAQKFQEFIDTRHGVLFAPHLLLTDKDLFACGQAVDRWAHTLLRRHFHSHTP